MDRKKLACGVSLAALFGAALAVPPPAVPKDKDKGITQEQADAILKELQAIRQLLQQMQAQQRPQPPRPPQPANQPVELKLETEFAMGRDDAPVTIIEFTDYQCPFCRRFHVETFPEIKKKYIDTGQVRFISRDLPLSIHANAFDAARAARCAGEQGKYWELRDVLIQNARNLGREAVAGYAAGLGLDSKAFAACVDSEKHDAEINQDIASANDLGITGTPTFIVGPTGKDVIKGLKLVGAQPIASFDLRLKQLLEPPAPAAAPATR